MSLKAFWESVQASPVADFVASSAWAFPTIETIHVIALVTVVGTIMIMDLRLVGATSKSFALTETSKDTLKWTWGAFGLAAVTGSLLFMSKASIYTIVPWFQWKMILLALAGLNMGLFEFITWKTVKNWDTDSEVPLAGKVAGWLSLVFWVLVVFCGRWVGFVLGQYQT